MAQSRSKSPPIPVGGLTDALSQALTSAGGRALERCARSRRPTPLRLLRGAAAGAGAAGIVYALRRFTDDPGELEFTDEVLAGAGRGVVYAAVLEPFLPGPPALRGALLGTMEYIMEPWGGAITHLQKLSPARKLPIVGALLETGDAEDDPYVSFLIYGIALGILYGDGDVSDD
jgi:hypothetical protein